jgi:hypothetical protein
VGSVSRSQPLREQGQENWQGRLCEGDRIVWAGQLALAFVSCTSASRAATRARRSGEHDALAISAEEGVLVRKMFYCMFKCMTRAWYARRLHTRRVHEI